MSDIKRIRLTRSIILNGGEHSAEGEVHDAPAALALRLVGDGSAEYVDKQEAPTTVNRMAAASNADPRTTKVSDAPGAKVTKHADVEDDDADEEKHKGKGKK